ncbi:hypothetical protein OAT16_06850 [Prolixibacteraceae bacterium]|nr:hypothetical protein [Prolixibacteraceae bacterium]
MKQLSTTVSKLFVVLSMLLSLFGCGIRDYNLDNLEVKKTEAQLAAPLAKGSLKVWDLIGNISKDYLVKDSNGEMKFVYKQENVIQYNLDDYFQFPKSMPIGGDNLEIPAMDFTLLSLLGPIPPIEFTNVYGLDVSAVSNSELNVYSVKIAEGNLLISVNNPSDLMGVNLIITLNNCTYPEKSHSEALSLRVELKKGQYDYRVDLSGALLDFVSNDKRSELGVSYRIEFPNNMNGKIAASSIDFSLAMNDLQFEYLKGNIGHQVMNIPTTEIDLDIPMFDKLGEGIEFAAPVFQLVTKCGFIIPTTIIPEISGENNNGKRLDLKVPAMSITCPSFTNYSDIANGAYRLDKNNSNIVEFFSLPPSKKITIGGSVKSNYTSDGNELTVTNEAPNMIVPNSNFSADLLMEVPLSLTAKSISFIDTMEISVGDISFVHDTHLYISYENRIPLELNLVLQPVNLESNRLVGAPIQMSVLRAPKVDENGYPISVRRGVEKIGLTKGDIDNLQKSDALILMVTANSSENKMVTLNAEDFINLRIAASAKVVYNENN